MPKDEIIDELKCRRINIVNDNGEEVAWIASTTEGASMGLAAQNGRVFALDMSNDVFNARLACGNANELLAGITSGTCVVSFYNNNNPIFRFYINTSDSEIRIEYFRDGQIQSVKRFSAEG